MPEETLAAVWNDKGEITGVKISSTIFIQGDGASDERAKQLNDYSSKNLKSRTENGVTVSFAVDYEYNENVTTKDLKAGQNILHFDKAAEDENHISEVQGTATRIGNFHRSFTGNYGTVYGSGNDNSTILHETMHLLGLSDRYDEDQANPLNGNKRHTTPHAGFEHDLMGSGELNLNKFHYQLYLYLGQAGSKIFKSDNFPYNRKIDRDNQGRLITPYEKNGIHSNFNADNQ